MAAQRRRLLAQLRRACRNTRALRRRHGLHASRAAAGQRASAGRVVGLPADRPLRADEPLRRARRLRALRRRLPSRGPRRDPRLGARALSGRPARPRAVRRHCALRARRPAPGLPPGLEHRDLRLRTARSRQLSHRERAVLARPVPHRRPAGRRRRVDALPRLFAQAGRMGAEPLRRQRESRGDRVPAQAERGRVRSPSGCGHDRGGVDGMAGRLATDLYRRPGLRLQVEPGLDARHAEVHAAGARAPAMAPRLDDVRPHVRVHRELRAAAVARRSRPRQGLAARADAGRRVAAVREPARVLRVHVGLPGQEAAVHGTGVRAGARVEFRSGARMVAARRRLASRHAVARARLQSRLPCAPRAARARLRAERVPLDRGQRPGPLGLRVAARRRRRRPAAGRGRRTSRPCRAMPTGSACRCPGRWREILNTDAAVYGGTDRGNGGGIDAHPGETPWVSRIARTSCCRRSARSGSCTTGYRDARVHSRQARGPEATQWTR